MYSRGNEKIYNEYLKSSFNCSNILTEKEYEKAYSEYDRNFGNVLPDNENARILDVGCGTGHFLYFLKKKGYKNFLGIDISPQQVEFCKKNVSETVNLADAFEFLNDTEGVYDVIVAHDVLEHIKKKNILDFLDLAFTSLNNNGIFIIRVPNMSNPFSLDSRYRDFTHETGFTEKSLYQVLYVSGFRDIEIFSTKIQIRSFRNRVRNLMLDLLHKGIRSLYYIQDLAVPKNLGKNLIVICKKS